MKHLIVLERPTEGQVYFMGKRIDHLDERSLAKIRMHFGFCFQMGALLRTV